LQQEGQETLARERARPEDGRRSGEGESTQNEMGSIWPVFDKAKQGGLYMLDQGKIGTSILRAGRAEWKRKRGEQRPMQSRGNDDEGKTERPKFTETEL